jgi:hypothetical protein
MAARPDAADHALGDVLVMFAPVDSAGRGLFAHRETCSQEEHARCHRAAAAFTTAISQPTVEIACCFRRIRP